MMRHRYMHQALLFARALARRICQLPLPGTCWQLQSAISVAFMTTFFHILPTPCIARDGVRYQHISYSASIYSGWERYENSYDSIFGEHVINGSNWSITPRGLLAAHVQTINYGGCWEGAYEKAIHMQRQFFAYIQGYPRLFRASSIAGGNAVNQVLGVSHCGPWFPCMASAEAIMGRYHSISLRFRLDKPTRVHIFGSVFYGLSYDGHSELTGFSAGAGGITSIYHEDAQQFVYRREFNIYPSGMDTDRQTLSLQPGQYVLSHYVHSGDLVRYATPCSQAGNDYIAYALAVDAVGLSSVVVLIFGSSREIPDITILLADLDGDGCITDADLLAVLMNFGAEFAPGDVNLDGVVDDADLLIVLSLLGECYL
jgi:hypothetical protein